MTDPPARPRGGPPRPEDRRAEVRFPAVGIDLLYCPVAGDCLEGAGESLRQAVAFDMSLSGLSFDVGRPLTQGATLLVLVDNPRGGPQERLLAEVRWCRELAPGHYRVGTVIQEARLEAPTGGELDPAPAAVEAIGKGPRVPTEAEFHCPACGARATFRLRGIQRGTWQRGIFPLYDCSACGTTRGISGILSHNRQRLQGG